ncbi:Rne/Rng family ribonuclease [Agromyces protaetiae]|uniref:Ribonuclease E n=1 Tax=Agromyces protaetiae TaxID=2509455 RepID=A0A4P6FCF0_9MICO|nr:Rne/Rng family ribonuclease [Agromyces protaetiae]QAY73980.1 Rne/Rng family ribonuclease [Agromyces protaetiae]
MVEGNDQQRNDTGEDATGGKRRGGLFGSRRSRGRRVQVIPSTATEVTGETDAAAAPIPVEATSADEAVTVEDTTATPEAAATVENESAETSESDDDGVAQTEEPAVEAALDPIFEPIPAGLTTTALIFRAPPVLIVPDRPERPERGERPEPAGEAGSTVRRRARRRSGEEGGPTGDEPANTIVKVRTPREPELITEPQRVKGSTRLEAKKQRRRDGRDAGRRRAVITEAEFLARREAVDREMVVRQKNGRIQIGVLEDNVLVEHYVARNQDASLIGNVYLGRVQNVLPSMEAAFVDIGRGRNAVLYSGEVDWDAAAENGEKNQPRRIELALKPGDRVLVQVTKDPVGHKGARLTSQVSLPGRYLVYVPNGSMNGISRKLPDTERARLKKILKEVLPENQGVIVRTAAEGATEEQLTLDVNRLIAQWSDISAQLEKVQAPALLHSEPDLLVKIVRDVFNEDFQKMIIEGDEARETIERYLRAVAPDLLERVEAYTGERDSFDEFRITEQIEKALDRKVWLPSGGSLVIDRTEAMTVVDVNTGKFVGSGGNLEETVTKNNLEAAEEIVRQLRLRDIGGIIVVDFIDMVLESNRDLVLRRLVECLSRDRTKHQVAEVTSLGLVQMTRKKLGLGLLESFSEPCEVCAGRGIIVHHEPIARHRAPAQPVERRRQRGGQQNQPAQQQAQSEPAKAHAGAHEITEDVKHALAQIAASTIAHGHDQPKGENGQADVSADAPAEGAAEQGASGAQQGEPGEGRSRNRRGRRRSSRGGSNGEARGEAQQAETTEASSEAEPTEVEVDETVVAVGVAIESDTTEAVVDPSETVESGAAIPLLELPLGDLPEPRERTRPVAADTEHLLDSVLDALPPSKPVGSGRSRSRRVSTAALSPSEGAPVIVRVDGEQPPADDSQS